MNSESETMMPLSITKTLSFCAAHRLIGHEGACANLHGHNYTVEVTIECSSDKHQLDSVGRIIDFSRIKKELQGWLDIHWDHATIINSTDTDLFTFLDKGKQKFYVLERCNATAEHMAQHLLLMFGFLICHPLRVSQVRVYETPTGCATARGV